MSEKEKESRQKVACEYGLYLLRKLRDEKKITYAQYEKAAKGFAEDMNCKLFAS